jgi:TPR repeat protein
MVNQHLYDQAAIALRKGDAELLRDAAEKLISSDYVDSHCSGYLMRGAIFEYGPAGIRKDLSRAVSDYRMAAHLTPHADAHWSLGRALGKSGDHKSAERFLLLAEEEGGSADLWVDIGKLYEAGPLQNTALALRYFRRAALSGRKEGIAGWSRVLRGSGRSVLGLIVRGVGVVATPLLLVVLGRKAFTADPVFPESGNEDDGRPRLENPGDR